MLEKTKYLRTLTLAISYVVSKFGHPKSKKTEVPLPTTPKFLGAMKTYLTRFTYYHDKISIRG